MKLKVPGKPSCSRISQLSTSATRPMPIAVPAYWIAMVLASCEKTYLVHQLCGWGSSTSGTSAGGMTSAGWGVTSTIASLLPASPGGPIGHGRAGCIVLSSLVPGDLVRGAHLGGRRQLREGQLVLQPGLVVLRGVHQHIAAHSVCETPQSSAQSTSNSPVLVGVSQK